MAGMSVLEPEIVLPQTFTYRDLNADDAGNLTKGVLPLDSPALEPAEIAMTGKPGDGNGLASLNRASIRPGPPTHFLIL